MMRDNVIPIAEIDSLSKEIECIMCLNTPNDSRMCIHCSAIVCVKCIESWLDKQKSCPKCSHSVQQTDFVKCRLANKLVDFIEISKANSCSNHSKQTKIVYCSTCKQNICSECILLNNQHLNHDYKYMDADYKQILTLNHKLVDFIRKRCKDNQEHLVAIELAIQLLFNDHTERPTEIVIKEKQCLFDDYQQRKQVYTDAIKNDESLLNDIERRLTDSKNLSDQEEILQILQKHIPSNVELRENVN